MPIISTTTLLHSLPRVFLLVVLYVLAAGASYNGFYSKVGLRETDPHFSAPAMVEGTAHRPYVYRQLLPKIAIAIDTAFPAAVASYNTESFLFFILALAPLYIFSLRDRKGYVIIGLAATDSLCVYLFNRSLYIDDPYANIAFYSNPLNLFKLENTYLLPLFAGYSFVTVTAIAIVTAIGGSRLSLPLKRFSLLCLGINLPLFILFAESGETRNLSFLYPTLVLLIAGTIDYFTLSPKFVYSVSQPRP